MTAARVCARCGKPIPEGKQASAIHCSDRCRMAKASEAMNARRRAASAGTGEVAAEPTVVRASPATRPPTPEQRRAQLGDAIAAALARREREVFDRLRAEEDAE